MHTSVARMAVFAWVGLTCLTAAAQEGSERELTAEQQEALAALQTFSDSLDRRTGVIPLGEDLATLTVPETFYFLNAEDTERVLVAWGNPPGQDNLGMLFPAKYSPFDGGTWAVTLQYVDDGHVSDSDATEIDYAALLDEMRSDIRSGNPEREAAGYPSIELVGWAEPPHYDAASRKLWSRDAQA